MKICKRGLTREKQTNERKKERRYILRSGTGSGAGGKGRRRGQQHENDQGPTEAVIDCSKFIQAAGVECLWVLECLNGLITCTDLPTAALASKTNWACAVIPHPLSVCLWGRPTLPLSLLALLWLLCTVLRHLTLGPHCVLP